MKTVLFTITTFFFLISVSFAEPTFSVITQDDKVTSIDQVRVQCRDTKTEDVTTTYTLPAINAKIAKKQARIAHLEGDISRLQALRAKVDGEARKVKLRELDKTLIKELN